MFFIVKKNTIDAPFKNKIIDNTEKAEFLEDDEFFGL